MALPVMGDGYAPNCGPIHPEIQHPEWQGSISSKWLDRNTSLPQSRRIVPTCCRNGDAGSFARQGPGRYFSDVQGLNQVEGKKIVAKPASGAYIWKPAKRSINDPGLDHYEKPEGLKRVETKSCIVRHRKEKLHIRQVESKEEYGDRQAGLNIVKAPNGLRAADQPAQEIDLSRVMQRKNRIEHLDRTRNGIPCRSLGDKQYRHPEYCSEFYKAGGLIVGCTFARGNFPKTLPRNSTAWKEFAAEQPDAVKGLSYQEREEQRLRCESQEEVEKLTGGKISKWNSKDVWETSTLQGQCNPPYEVSDSENEADKDDTAPARR